VGRVVGRNRQGGRIGRIWLRPSGMVSSYNIRFRGSIVLSRGAPKWARRTSNKQAAYSQTGTGGELGGGGGASRGKTVRRSPKQVGDCGVGRGCGADEAAARRSGRAAESIDGRGIRRDECGTHAHTHARLLLVLVLPSRCSSPPRPPRVAPARRWRSRRWQLTCGRRRGPSGSRAGLPGRSRRWGQSHPLPWTCRRPRQP